MISGISDSKNAYTSSTNENHTDDLKVWNGEDRPSFAGSHPGTKADAASAGIRHNLQVIKDSMVAAETAMIQHGWEAAKATGCEFCLRQYRVISGFAV